MDFAENIVKLLLTGSRFFNCPLDDSKFPLSVQYFCMQYHGDEKSAEGTDEERGDTLSDLPDEDEDSVSALLHPPPLLPSTRVAPTQPRPPQIYRILGH